MSRKLNTLWVKAAVLGSLWAGNEIIVGSFLHNLRIPMSGTFLAMISIALMSGFLMIWKEKGLIIRAGLIAALMKSISPSAIIMGPMIGIMSEAIMMELVIALLGVNRLGILLGGMMGVFSTFLQKVITVLIVYGFDFVVLLDNMFRFATKQLRLDSIEPKLAVWSLAGLYLCVGLLAAFVGIIAGSRSKTMSKKGVEKIVWVDPKTYSESNTQSSLFHLFLHVISIVIILYLLNTQDIILSTVVALVYAAVVLIKYKNSLQRLKSISFWIQMLILVLVTSLFWKWYENGTIFHVDGLIVGLKMVMRALVVMLGFAAISIEIRNPLIKHLLLEKGMDQLYLALGVAFSALPTILDRFIQPKSLVLSPITSLSSVISKADELHKQFAKQMITKGRLYILTAPIDSGKTSFLIELIEHLKHGNKTVDGVLSLKLNHKIPKLGYEIWHIQEDKKELLCDNVFKPKTLNKGPFYFNEQAFENGKATLIKAMEADADLLLLDEIGPIELKGSGWHSIMQRFIDSDKDRILVVRDSVLHEVVKFYNLSDFQLVTLNPKSKKALIEAFLSN